MSRTDEERRLFDHIMNYYHDTTTVNCSYEELEAITPLCDAAMAHAVDVFEEDGLVTGHTRIAHAMLQISDALAARRIDNPVAQTLFEDELHRYDHIPDLTDKLSDFVNKK